ncbi:MAG: hypothetical protein H0X30_01735 [Anaerolineae bacterium]|nr:hypothetical protein [Anaerolineae bacterium]
MGFSLVVIGGVAGGLRKAETVEIRTHPNEGIRSTLRTAIRVMIAFGLVGALVGGLIGWLLSTLPNGDFEASAQIKSVIVLFTLIIGLMSGLGLGLIMGGSDAVVKHYVLRFFLQRAGSIPRNYARLLDYAADRILLRKVGGGYIFIHRYLLEYFASLEPNIFKE